MRADNRAHLVAAAQRRHELTLAKAIWALREFAHTGTPVTFQTVADRAEVSRSWLDTQSDINAEIQRRRRAERPDAAGTDTYLIPRDRIISTAAEIANNPIVSSARTTSDYAANSPKPSDTTPDCSDDKRWPCCVARRYENSGSTSA